MEDVAGALADSVEGDTVEAEGGLPLANDLDVTDQRVAHDDVDRQVDVDQLAVGGGVTALLQGDADPLGVELIDVQHALAQPAGLPGQVDVLDPRVDRGVAEMHVAQVERAGDRPFLGADRQLARDVRAEVAEEKAGAPLGGDRVPPEPGGEDEQEDEREQQAEQPAQGPAPLAGGW